MADLSALEYLNQQMATPQLSGQTVSPMASNNPENNAGGINQGATTNLPILGQAMAIQPSPESQRTMEAAEKQYRDALDAEAHRARAEQIGQIGEKLYTGIAAIGLGAAGGRAGGMAGMELLNKAHQDAQQARLQGSAYEQQHLNSLKSLIDIHNKGMLGDMAQSVKLAQTASKEKIAEQAEAAKNMRLQHVMGLKAAVETLKNARGEKALEIKKQLANETVQNNATKNALAGMGLQQRADELGSLNKYRDAMIQQRAEIANMQSEDKRLGRRSEDNNALLRAQTQLKVAAAQYIAHANIFNAGLEKDLNQKDELGKYKYSDDKGDPLKFDDIKLDVPEDPEELLNKWGKASEPTEQAPEPGATPIPTPTSIGAMPTSVVPDLPTGSTLPPVSPALRAIISKAEKTKPQTASKDGLTPAPKAKPVTQDQLDAKGLTPKQKAINASVFYYSQPAEWQKKNLQSFIDHYGHSPATFVGQ